MDLKFVEIDKDDLTLFKLFAKWDSDPVIKPFITPRRSEEEVPDYTAEELMEHAKQNTSKHIYVLYDGEKPIGTSTIDTDFFFLKSGKEHVAWISILIGDKNYWGKGLSKAMMAHLEGEARRLGCQYIELGVFEFNQKAQSLYKRMGYDVFEIIEKFVYHDGQWKNDIRMLKKL